MEDLSSNFQKLNINEPQLPFKIKYDGQDVILKTPKAQALVISHLQNNKNNEEGSAFIEHLKKEINAEDAKRIETIDKCDFSAIEGFLSNFKELADNGIFRKHVIKLPTLNLDRSNIVIYASADSISNEKKLILSQTFLASWTEDSSKTPHYGSIGWGFDEKGCLEYDKFETARLLHSNIGNVRKGIETLLNSEFPKEQQLGITIFLLDELAIRIGDKNNTNTFGCISLQVRHIKLTELNTKYSVEFKFQGKCDIPYQKKIEVNKQKYDILLALKMNKDEDDFLFDKINAKNVNDYLKNLMPGLTAKVFRTYHGSRLMEEELSKSVPSECSNKTIFFEEALKIVADFLNHKKNIESEMKTNTVNTLKSYIDPRIVFAWCELNAVPTSNVYTKSLLKDFDWTESTTNKDFRFTDFDSGKTEYVFYTF